MIDKESIQRAASAIIEAIGEDPRREGLIDTPRRIAQMYEEFFSGLAQDPVEVLATGFEESHDELVVLRDIPFFSVCEHHFLPLPARKSARQMVVRGFHRPVRGRQGKTFCDRQGSDSTGGVGDH